MERRLAAIFSTDVQGYSRLMGDNEVATVQPLTEYRDVLTTLIETHRGRVVDSPGDNLLAEFASVVDAVESAVSIQRELEHRNAVLPSHRQMHFRIGINLGDVLIDGDRIYGDGVNIAARIESLAEAGEICLSGTAYDQVQNKLALEYVALGEHTVKNISQPVRVYQVRYQSELDAPITTQEMTKSWKRWQKMGVIAVVILLVSISGIFLWYSDLPLSPFTTKKSTQETGSPSQSTKPSIAVLPFANFSDDPKQDYFVDGLTDDLITDLSKVSGLLVIARHSTFVYKGKTLDLRQVARELDVRYVLEGSVRRSGERIRVNAQLIDAMTGGHLWAERYDSQMDDIFSLQDTLTRKIVTALTVTIPAGEQLRVPGHETRNVAAYDAFLQGREYLLDNTPEILSKAVASLEQTIRLDPDYARAYAWLALAYYRAHTRGWFETLGLQRSEALTRSKAYLQKALKNPTPDAYWVASRWYAHEHKFEEAISASERAIAMDPNNANSHFVMAHPLILAGRPNEGVQSLEMAMRLNPHYPAFYIWYLGLAYLGMEEFDKTVTTYNRAFKRNPKLARWPLVVALAHLGRVQEAEKVLKEYQQIRGWSSLGHVSSLNIWFPYQHQRDWNRFATGLVKAGMTGYFRMASEDKLNEREIHALVFGRTLSGYARTSAHQFWITRTKDGRLTRKDAYIGSDTGRSWTEGDLLCDQYETIYGGRKWCSGVYRNPDGNRALLNEYVTREESFVAPWSPIDSQLNQ